MIERAPNSQTQEFLDTKPAFKMVAYSSAANIPQCHRNASKINIAVRKFRVFPKIGNIPLLYLAMERVKKPFNRLDEIVTDLIAKMKNSFKSIKMFVYCVTKVEAGNTEEILTNK